MRPSSPQSGGNFNLAYTYTLKWRGTNPATSICNVPLCVVNLGDPHGEGWKDCEETGDGDTNLDNLPACTRLVVVTQRIFQRQQTVEVDEDKVVDGGAEQDDLHGGHQVTQDGAEPPKADPVRADE